MKNRTVFIHLFSISFLFLTIPIKGQTPPSGMKIWFNRPAETWNDALPIGNGRLGAMVFGGIEKDRIQLNEESVWTGAPRWDANPDALKNLPKVRKLLFEGKYLRIVASSPSEGS